MESLPGSQPTVRAPRTIGAATVAPLLLMPLFGAHPLLAQEQGMGSSVSLECRLADGPWQQCRMQVQQVGEHWFLVVGRRQFEFRHDGSGQVTMQQNNGQRRSVSATWQADASLCWDGVCARGAIPLD
ncbi:MAG: hypothetical protein VKN13_04630 [Cyanobacteriota bacterium]|nr:hypothetical protein [Cyanobacteriota bacterium]